MGSAEAVVVLVGAEAVVVLVGAEAVVVQVGAEAVVVQVGAEAVVVLEGAGAVVVLVGADVVVVSGRTTAAAVTRGGDGIAVGCSGPDRGAHGKSAPIEGDAGSRDMGGSPVSPSGAW